MNILTISDTHGFLAETKAALENTGLMNNGDTRVALLGDILDRGTDAIALTDYLTGLLQEGKLILIRGNHEDLLESALEEIECGRIYEVATAHHHRVNGTFDTLLQLSGMSANEAVCYPKHLLNNIKNSAYYKTLLPACIDYYETEKYILTHGWIPSVSYGYGGEEKYFYNPNWRNATKAEWRRARWFNGMKMAVEHGVVEPDKTIICGHYHTSYGHSKLSRTCSEYGADADFSPFYADGIIAIDGCVAHTRKINCVVIDV